jgi:two-component system phosphate regulon sensor histidine kinase PhoR
VALFGWPDPLQRAIEALRAELTTGAPAHLSPEVQELANLLAQRAERLSQARTQHDMLQQLLDGVPDAAGIFDAGGRLRMANRAFLELRGGGRASGHTALEATRSAELAEVVALALRGQGGQLELTLPAAGRTVRAYLSPLGNGEALLQLRDLTEAKKLEVARRDFVANASHELRTPVSAIVAAVETLQIAAPALPEGAQPFIDIIARQAERLRRLTDVMLDLSRLESGEWRLELQPVELGPLCAQALELVRDRAAPRRIALASEVPPALFAIGDRRALEQVLVNLLDNAVKYSSEGGSVTIAAARANSQVELSVRDSGAGIEPRHLQRLFERFYRADPSRARHQGGTGLGLAIVKHLTQAQHGEVGVESGAQGSRFWVRLPVAEPSPS